MLKRGNGEVGRDFDAINEDKVLHVVTNLVPIGYFVSGDTIAGYNHDLLAALQTYTDIRFDVKVENSLEKSFEGLKKGKYDLVARNIPINANLRDEYGFTEPILYNKLILVQRKAEFNDGIQPIRNHLQLAKKTICVPKESPSIFRLQNLSHEIGDTIFVNEDNTYEAEQLAMMVADKEIDFTVCDGKTAAKLSANIPELDVSTDIGFTHLEGWATRNNSPVLLDSLNVWINRFKKTKAYSAILRKYYRQ
jgi:membrane-bound lytic murein transglycosylase MltF